MADGARTTPLQLGTYHMANNNVYEPQRTNNFEVQITGFTGSKTSETITLAVDSYSAPQINISVIEVPYGNNRIKFAGTPTFENSSITLNDFIGQDVEKQLSNWQKEAYDYDTQAVGFATEYKKIGYLIEYDPKGGTPRQWKLVGCWIANLNLGNYAQGTNEVRKIECQLVYDYAIPA